MLALDPTLAGPPVAYDFRDLVPPKGFTNINSIFDLRSVKWLHPTQSMYGNWGAESLLLGQDFNGLQNLRGYKLEDLKHDPRFATNKNIANIFSSNISIFYANYFWFIKDGYASSMLSTRKEVIDANKVIFDATMNAMPNLKKIFSMGKSVSKALGLVYDPMTVKLMKLSDRDVEVYQLPHLGQLGITNFSKKMKLNYVDAVEKIKLFTSGS